MGRLALRPVIFWSVARCSGGNWRGNGAGNHQRDTMGMIDFVKEAGEKLFGRGKAQRR